MQPVVEPVYETPDPYLRSFDAGALREHFARGDGAAIAAALREASPPISTLLDLDFPEDSAAAVDLNVVMTGEQEYVELQGTAERSPFTGAELEEMLRLANVGIAHISSRQQAALES